MTQFLRLGGAVLVVGALLSCSEGPTAGELEIVLDTPRSDLGAIQFVIVSSEPASVDSVVAVCAGCNLFDARIGTAEVRGIVTGLLSAGVVLRITVPDLALAASYAISVQQASTRDYQVLPPSGMVLRVSVPR
jgi:hypothetical protein